MIPTTPPSGFRDFLPDACALRAQSIAAISEVYRSFGFSQIATPAVEDLAVLLGKGGGENEKLIFKILKRGEKLDLSQGASELADLGLRFDLTLPLARFYSRHQSALPHPFKAFHIGPVWRAERAQKGRYREFFQCDADVVGSESLQAEVDVISAILTAFARFGLAEVKVHLNDRAVLFALLERAGVPAEKRGPVCVAIDKLDKVPQDVVIAEIAAQAGDAPARAIASSITADGRVDEAILTQAAPEPFARLKRLLEWLSLAGFSEKIELAPWLVRGFDYYTSTVFEFRHPGLAGSLGGGGRYDHLTEKFGGPATPACGASIGFERLMLLLEEKSAGAASGPDVCVTVFSEAERPASLAAALMLRQAGLSADVYPGTGKLKAQFRYADARRARWTVVIGPDEAAAGKIKVKEMGTGAETEETVAALAARLASK